MSKNGSGLFGGMFDLNGDGKEDMFEKMTAFSLFEETFEEDEEENNSWRSYGADSSDSDDYDDE